jgi:hypothetical protein
MRLKAGASCFELVPCWPGGEDFQRFGQTCRAAFVQFRVGPLSGAYWRGPQPADRGYYGTDHRTGHRNLGELEGDGASVTHHTGADFDQLQLEAG